MFQIVPKYYRMLQNVPESFKQLIDKQKFTVLN